MKSLWLTLSLVVLFIAMSLNGIAQEAGKSEKKSKTGSEMSVDRVEVPSKSRSENFVGRLPRFFSSIVNSRQRAEIYDIQRSFLLRKQDLEQQLAAMKQTELAAIEQVLTAEQLSQLDALRTTADVQRKPSAEQVLPADSTEPQSTNEATKETEAASEDPNQTAAASPKPKKSSRTVKSAVKSAVATKTPAASKKAAD
jgi:hypothetical protein